MEPAALSDLSAGRNEWLNIQDVIRTTFQTLNGVILEQRREIQQLRGRVDALEASSSRQKSSQDTFEKRLRDFADSKADASHVSRDMDKLRSELGMILETKFKSKASTSSIEDLQHAIDELKQRNRSEVEDVSKSVDDLRSSLRDTFSSFSVQSSSSARSIEEAAHRIESLASEVIDVRRLSHSSSSDLKSSIDVLKSEVISELRSKADVSTVSSLSSELMNKADISLVNAALETKANKASVATALRTLRSILDEKADTQRLERTSESLQVVIQQSQKEVEEKIIQQLHGSPASLVNSSRLGVVLESERIRLRSEWNKLNDELAIKWSEMDRRVAGHVSDLRVEMQSAVRELESSCSAQVSAAKKQIVHDVQRQVDHQVQSWWNNSKEEEQQKLVSTVEQLASIVSDRKADRSEVSDLVKTSLSQFVQTAFGGLNQIVADKQKQSQAGAVMEQVQLSLEELREAVEMIGKALERKASSRDIAAQLDLKADIAAVNRIMAQHTADVEQVLAIKADAGVVESIRSQVLSREELFALLKDKVDLSLHARDVSRLDSTKADKAELSQVSELLSRKADWQQAQEAAREARESNRHLVEELARETRRALAVKADTKDVGQLAEEVSLRAMTREEVDIMIDRKLNGVRDSMGALQRGVRSMLLKDP